MAASDLGGNPFDLVERPHGLPISACFGVQPSGAGVAQGYPRACGAYYVMDRSRDSATGLPPRVRGLRRL